MKIKHQIRPKKKGIKGVRNVFEYIDFIQWISLPKSLRTPETQRDLAVQFGIGEDTLSDWKKRDGFWEEVEGKRKSWGRERTPEVLLGLFNRASKTGDPRSVRLWLEVIEGMRFNDKAPDVICEHCSKYEEFELMSDEDLKRVIKEGEAFFNKE